MADARARASFGGADKLGAAMDLLTSALVAAWLAASPGPAAPRQRALDDRELARALTLAGGTEQDLQRFAAQYRLQTRQPVRTLEVFTPFRRAVTLARAHTARTGQTPGIHGLRTLMAGEEATMRVHSVISLDPRHAFVRPPDYSILLIRGAERVRPVSVERRALGPSGAVVPSNAVGGAVVMAAVEVEASFAGITPGDPACCRIVVTDEDGTPLMACEMPDSIR